MKKILFCCLLGIISLTANAGNPKRVIVIALDGISINGFTKANTPHLDALLSEGALSLNTRVVMPSVTLPNWTSHLTGSGPEQHGVFNNDWTLADSHYPLQDKDADGYYPSVFTVIKEQKPEIKTAFYYNWINLFYPYNKKYLDEVSYLENDGYKENYAKALDFMLQHKQEPVLVFLYSVHTDHAGHKHQWMSDEYIQSIEEADAEIGALIEKMKANDLYKDTYFLFVSDHGGIKYGHGGTSSDEMIVPWGIKGPKIKKGFIMEEPNNTVNTASVILHLFKIKQPDAWIGKVPHSIFK